MRRYVLLLTLLVFSAGLTSADEGMWLYNHFPAQRVKTKYGFLPTQAWLDHARLGSVRFNNGGSGSFVSADGLAFTNHHVAQTCLHGLSTESKDLYKTGFYAKTQAEEAKCPDLELNQLVGIEDVTAKVQGAVTPGMSPAEAARARRAVTAQIESECTKSTGLRCDVVTLYAGGMYNLYRYKKYTDVRLVFAPEFDAAFFGGDPDNFEYPRWDLDITFFRVYENDKPVHLDHYLKFSHAGIKDGELIFVSGHPGSTSRMDTVAQIETLRDLVYPFRLDALKRRNAALKAWAAQSPENYRRAQEDIFGIENSIKAITGYLGGIRDPKLMARKQEEESKLQAWVNADAQRKSEYGEPWAATANAERTWREIYLPFSFLDRRAGFPGDLNFFARALVRAAVEKAKANAERLPEYRDSSLPSLEQQLFSTAPVYRDLETVSFADALALMQEKLGADDEVVKQVLNGRTPAEAAKELIAGTRLDDVNVRKQLYEGGQKAIAASDDPLIVMMRAVEPRARALRKRFDDEVQSVERTQGATLAKIHFAQGGTDTYPDATFTLRLSYGQIKGFTEDGQGTVPAGTKVPYFTTFAGAFQHAQEHGNKDPYQLPQSWWDAKSKLNLNTPLNAVETADIIGGNSGSPVLNTKGEVVGIIFDGNIQSLPWDFVYDDSIGRSVHVDSRGIIEALRAIYHADGLANELMGPPATKPAPKAK
ncbi:MAG TPA: S46 family peptidase [Terriglobales bacterium]|nr:S46 family peptidase [Terriglobales bacterium]